jgi:cephalosporin-C deacetylase
MIALSASSRAAGRLFVLSLALFLSASVHAAFKFAVENDHTNLLYRVGEEARFTVSVTEKDGTPASAGTVEVELDNFGPKSVLKKTVDLAAGNPFTVSGALAEPGFLRLALTAKDSVRQIWSVGYDPEKLEKGSPSPADFDAFWAEARAKLAREVPLDAKVQRIAERSTAEFDFFRISFATYGRRVYGYMSVPTDKSKAPYPVEFQVSAAGFGGWTNDMSGDAGRIKVFFAVYPWAPHWDWKALGLNVAYDYMNAACKAKYGTEYSQSGIAKSREDYFFYPVLLGIDRAVTWVAAREDVDRSRFCYQGTSQGGGFGFYLTGLNPAFTRAAFFVPAITDTMGYLKGRQSGWPQVVENQPADQKAAAEKNAPYFDAANFASRIRCPVRVAVGFSDPTCPPCAVYSAYNEIKVADKGIVHGFGMTHSCYGWIYGQLGDWLWK